MKKLTKLCTAMALSAVFALVSPVSSTIAVKNNPFGVNNIYVDAASVKLNSTKKTLIKGETYTLKMVGTKKKVTWKSSKSSVVSVNSKGKITAKAKGQATITAKVGSKKYTCKVTVETPKISNTSVTLTKGKTKTLKVSGTSQKISWSTSSKSVAVVNSKGKVTAKGKGQATITAKIGTKKYNCKVTVKNNSDTKKPVVKGISFTEFRSRLKGYGWKLFSNTTYEYWQGQIFNGHVNAKDTGAYFVINYDCGTYSNVLKQCFIDLLPTQGAKLYSIVSNNPKTQTLKMDGRTVKIYNDCELMINITD